MYFQYSAIIVLFCVTNLSLCAPFDDEEDVQLLDMYQSRREDASEFMFSLNNGHKREEKIRLDNLERGIAIRGSYNIELENGEMQTIYYISDNKGHRISINVPFPEDEVLHRPPPTRKPQNHEETRKRNQAEIDERFKFFEQNRVDEIQRRGKVQEISQESGESKVSNEKSNVDSVKEGRFKVNRIKDTKAKIYGSNAENSNIDRVRSKQENSKADKDGKVEEEESKDSNEKSDVNSAKDQRFRINRVKDEKVKSEISKDEDSNIDRNNEEKDGRSKPVFSRSRLETTTPRKIFVTSEKPILIHQKIEHIRKIGYKTLRGNDNEQEDATTKRDPEVTTEKDQEVTTEKDQEITSEKDQEITSEIEKELEVTSEKDLEIITTEKETITEKSEEEEEKSKTDDSIDGDDVEDHNDDQ